MGLVKKQKEKNDTTEVIVLSSEEDTETNINAIKVGAKEYIPNKYGAWKNYKCLYIK